MMWSRRVFAKRLAGALLQGDPALLARMNGIISAAYIVRRGGAVRRLAVGQALVHGAWTPFTADQLFRVASISKTVPASRLLSLVSHGRADLDADVSIYLRETLRHPGFPDIIITPRMLLSHTSGLRNGEDFPVPFNRPLLARLSAAADEENFSGWFAPAHEPPGAWFSYSDTNYAVIAQIIERITDTRFDRFMRHALFEPLGLDIGYNWSGVSQTKRDRAAAACRWVDGARTPQVDGAPPPAPQIAFYRGESNDAATEAEYSVGLNGFAFAPHGGLRLSLNDMEALARFYLDGARLAGESSLAHMITPHWTFDPTAPNGATERGWYQRFGLGVHVPLGRDAPGASPGDAFFGPASADWRGHFGDAYGWITGLVWNSRENATLVYVLNGMPETGRPLGARSAMSAHEETLIDAALG